MPVKLNRQLVTEPAFLRFAARRLMGASVGSLETIGEVEVIHPPEERGGDPAIFLPGQVEKVEGVAFEDVESQLDIALGRRRTVRGIHRSVIRDALVFNGSVFAKGQRLFLSPERDVPPAKDGPDYEEGFGCSSMVGCHFFGHWLRDDCASMLLDEPGPRLDLGWPDWQDGDFYRAQFGVSATAVRYARVKRLILVEDFHQNSHKAERFRTLRARVAAHGTPRPGPIVYLARGGGTARNYENEAEVIDLLAARGVDIVRTESSPTPETVSRLLGASMVIGIEGSQFSHALYTIADKAALLTIQPPTRFFMSHKDWSDSLGMKHGFVVGDRTATGYRLNPEDLLRTIDLLV